MKTLSHPYLFQQVDSGECGDADYAVYTLAPDESLFVHWRTHRRFPETVAKFFVAEVVLVLGYLHSHGYVFWNMGPETIFLDEAGHACVSDFFLSFTDEVLQELAQRPDYTSRALLLCCTLRGKED